MDDAAGQVVVIPFRLGEEWYAALIESVLEVLKPPPVTIVPNVSDVVLGVVNIRGNITSVVDLKRLLGIPETPITAETRVIVIRASGRTTGLLTDCVGSVMGVPKSSVQEPLTTIPEARGRYVKGEIALDDGRLLAVLDLDEVMQAEEFAGDNPVVGTVGISA